MGALRAKAFFASQLSSMCMPVGNLLLGNIILIYIFRKRTCVLDRKASLIPFTAADSPPVIAAPSMWTRPQIKDFKEKIRQDVDSVITVGRGEVVTVRVPTHEEGSYLFWEFATDYYDIGFGVFFEWTDAASVSVSVHVSESSDEDEEGEVWVGSLCV